MDYCQVYFGTGRENLNLQIIANFFEIAKDENDSLEFKSFVEQGEMNTKYDGLCKSLCAFLNSNGGILIWGAPVGQSQQGRKEKIFQGALAPINQVLEKDSLISIVSSRITPLPNGVNVKIIDNNNGGCICVFEVQKSNSAHQIKGVYYMRIDGQSVPAPHHYVEALIKKITYPELCGYLKFNKFYHQSNTYILRLTVMIFNWTPLQNEKTVSFRLTTDKGRFQGWNVPQLADNYAMKGKQLINREMAAVLHYGAPVTESCTIHITPEEIVGNEYLLNLYLHFGGENSPMKQSKYVLRLRQLNANESVNTLMESVIENDLLADLQQNNGLTREQTLTEILGRAI